jgi:hypothetical protein
VRRGVVMVKPPGLFSPKFGATSSHVFTQPLQNVAVEPGIHSLAFWERCFALPQLLYRWRQQSGIFWIPTRIQIPAVTSRNTQLFRCIQIPAVTSRNTQVFRCIQIPAVTSRNTQVFRCTLFLKIRLMSHRYDEVVFYFKIFNVTGLFPQNREKQLSASPCLSVYQHRRTLFPLYGFL